MDLTGSLTEILNREAKSHSEFNNGYSDSHEKLLKLSDLVQLQIQT